MSKQINESTHNEEVGLHLNRLYEVLSLVNQAMVRARSPEELFAEVCRIAVENGAFMLVWIGLYNPETHAVIPVAWAGEPLDFVRKVNVFADNRPRGRGPTGSAIREGVPVIINNTLQDRHSFPWREALDEAGIRAAASFPFKVKGVVHGALSLYVNKMDYFKDKEITLLEEVSRDISFCLERMEEEKQRRLAQAALKESEWRYREVFVNASNGIFALDVTSEGKFRFASLNPSGEKMLGYSIVDIQGKSPEEFLSPENAEILNANYNKCINANAPVSYEYEIGLKAGYRYFQTTLVPVRDSSGRICRIIGIADNITERKQVELELRQSEKKYRQLMELAQEGIWVIDLDARTTFVNPRMAEMLGYTVKEMIGRTPYSFVEDCSVEAWKAIFEHRKQGVSEQFDFIFIRKDGTRIYTSMTASPIVDDNGNFAGSIAVAADITERKKAEEALRESEANLRRITDNMMDMITQTDAGLVYCYVSPSHKSFLGYEPKDLIGRSVLDFVHRSDLKRTAEMLDVFFKTKEQIKLEVRYRHVSGHYLWIESTGNILLDDRGRVTGAIFEKHDITERKTAEMKVKAYEIKLRSLAAKLSLAEERERRRIALDIHDHIGQSLAVAKMELGALRELMPNATLKRNVDEIETLIKKTIQYTRSLTFEISPPILYELGFEAAVQWLGEQIIEKHGIRFNFRDDGQSKPMDDEIRVILYTAVREILMNIIKHAKARRALVSIQKQGKNLIIVIEDDGSGFDISKRGFNLSKIGGFGLFSVRERLVHMGGNMEIKSKHNMGTIVTMEAPLRRR
ncbi:MAG: Oxygen sensor histidine kinase NreB [Pelotomaculum sp. PtaB.Bin013]|uniref:histidine kinase n=1 Tax=Pelotomaculum isophthalicicum JI TaxID=947010 RepID=A0A9X4JSQ9_9FIRM|nr:PAS domain S-box protein [Pelotomaculum isophthalicicum]MDF9407164.1 PAS domain S-box protein [Pelotomaculum isophthalicicum JI]OPX87124.1 MAG: Oxygen sensor histidine kinase NreB [Pelotomaculum sp. PtaB.Bin013]